MMTLYTAIGQYMYKPDNCPAIVANNKEFILDAHELLLWSSLAFRILTYDELKKEFYEKKQELHILGELEFDYYLNRLTLRRLVCSGRDYTGKDALYCLFAHLYLKPVDCLFPARFFTFCKLFFGHRLTFPQAFDIFRREKLMSEEKSVLRSLKYQLLSTAELIHSREKGQKVLRTKQDLMKCLYNDETTDCNNIAVKSRFADQQLSILAAVANLYLKQMIVLEIL